ncbi:Unsaturated rhamnogalacturonyl hydrolase YteR [compost metagenome]
MGWYAMALADALEHFPIDHPKRGTIIGIFERMCHAICRVQDKDTGLWFQVLDQGRRKGNYLEASCSSMFVYSMAKGARLGFLESHFQANAERGYAGIIERFVSEDAKGVHVCSINHGAGLSLDRDGSYSYYISEAVVSNSHIGVAPFILASLEIEKLES